MKRILSVFVFVFVFVSINAIPAWYGVMQHVQEDGTTINYRIMGDEHGHMLVTLDGYALVMDRESLCYANIIDEATLPPRGEDPSVEGCGVRVVSTGVMAHDAEMRSEEEIKALDSLCKADPLCPRHLPHYGENLTKTKRGMKHALNIDDFPTTGEMHGLILLVNFANVKMLEEHTVEVFDRKMNEEGCTLYNATGSARDYFIDQSWGQFQPTFDVCGIIELDNNFSYYGRNNGFGQDEVAQLMIKEACEKAHNQMGVDFANYDYDNDGYVDFVYVIFAGYAESYGAPAETIWPHASNLEAYGIDLVLDGKKIDKYACSSELKYNAGETIEGIGTFCHEFSHVLGLPDAYNVRASGDPQLGRWDVMDQGNYNNESNTPAAYSAYERKQVRWLEFTPLDEPQKGVELQELNGSHSAYIITTSKDNEFFTLENRQQVGWDKYLPGHGMMVFHVEFERSMWEANGVNSGMYPRYDLVEADGTQGNGAASDLFPGTNNVTCFTDYTSPGMLMHDGTPVGKGLTHIKEYDDDDGGLRVVTFDFMYERLASPLALEATEVTATSFVANWEPVDDALGYRLTINEDIPEDEQIIILDEDFSGMVKGEYPYSDYIPLENLDGYTAHSGWTGTDVYECGGMIRLGSYGVSGSLTSYAFNANEDEPITIAFTAQSYTGKQVSFTMDVIDDDNDRSAQGDASLDEGGQKNVYNSNSYKVKKTPTEFVIHIAEPHATSRLAFNTENERLFIDRVRVLRTDIADEEVWNITTGLQVADTLLTTSHLVENLRPERTYHYVVQALNDEPLMQSDFSNEITVATLKDVNAGEVGGAKIANDKLSDCKLYNLAGQRVDGTYKGIVITNGRKIRVKSEK